jgi:hypothetical protein
MDMDKARRVAMLKELKSHYEVIAEKIGSEINKLGVELYEQFADDELKSMRIGPEHDGRIIFNDHRERIIKPELKYKPTVKDQVKFFSWLRKEKYGEIIKESVHPKTLESFVTERKTQNLALPPVDTLTIYDFKTVKVSLAPQTKASPKGD